MLLPSTSLLLTLSSLLVDSAHAASKLSYVDPLIGTLNGGHVFPGATLPFGMAKAVADVTGENQGGFASDGSPITGFSHMHDSGTGGGSSLGNFPIFPHLGCPGDEVSACTFTKADRATARVNGTVEARPGYFAITLNTSVKAEMTVSNHTALYRFTFPANGTADTPLSPLILAELSDLSNSQSGGSITVNNSTGRIAGNSSFAPSFGIGRYTLHFCADFTGAQVRDTGFFPSSRSGAWTRFKTRLNNSQILARVGVSFISVTQACRNAEQEIPRFDFELVVKNAEGAWEDKFSVIDIDAGGASEELQTVFWSGLYRSMISPQDYTGENPLWTSDEPYYDSFYCIWDSFRSIHPLLTLVDPDAQARMIRSLLDIYQHEGHLPDCRMSLCKGYTQGGSNADIVLADSFLKNITAGINWTLGYEAVLADAEVCPSNWAVEGRGGIDNWRTIGYIPIDDRDPHGTGPFTRSGSRTVEYAYDDFCIAAMAEQLGSPADRATYMARSRNWRNLYKADQPSFINGTDTGFTGFLQPRYANGTWAYQDPIRCSPLLGFTTCYLNPTGGEFYEGPAWLYTLFAPHDMASLIATLGGPAAFLDRLDFLHESGLLYLGDEQAFLTLYLYHYAGQPNRSAARARAALARQFNTSAAGIPGNDDSGAMGSFAVLALAGLFPNPGQPLYFLTPPPFFRELNWTDRRTGAVATVRNRGDFDPARPSYVQSVRLDGEPYTPNWIGHDFFLRGGVLEFELGEEESDWGTAEADLPPSLPVEVL